MKKIKKKINQKPNSVSFISGPYKLFKEIEKETFVNNREKADIVNEHLCNWYDVIKPIIKNNPDLSQSLVGIRFIETFTDMQLAVFSILSGCYFQAVRNLRFTFESMIQAIYIEMHYPEFFPVSIELSDHTNGDIDIQTMVEKELKNKYTLNGQELKCITGFRTEIINKLFFLDDLEKNKLKITYKKLSRLVHPAPEQIKKIIKNPDLIFTFSYNEKFFNECVELTDEVMDVAFAIVLCRFPDMKQNIKTKENALLYDSLVRLPITNRLLNN